MYTVEADNIYDAHLNTVKTINDNGAIVKTEDCEWTLELIEPLCIHVRRPLSSPMFIPEVGFSKNYMEEYAVQLGYTSDNSFSYTYGNRLRDYYGTDQRKEVIDKLVRHPTSRRAIMHTWMVEIDINGKHVPCMQTVQFLLRRSTITGESFLNCIATFRSNDMLMAWGCNAYGLAILTEDIADALDCEVGYLSTLSTSAHIYHRRDESTLNKVLRL